MEKPPDLSQCADLIEAAQKTWEWAHYSTDPEQDNTYLVLNTIVDQMIKDGTRPLDINFADLRAAVMEGFLRWARERSENLTYRISVEDAFRRLTQENIIDAPPDGGHTGIPAQPRWLGNRMEDYEEYHDDDDGDEEEE